MSLLLNIPCEIVLQVFCHLPTVRDALALADTCSFLREVFQAGGNRLQILMSIMDVPEKQSFDVEVANSLIVRAKPREWYIRSNYPYSLHFTLDYDHLSEDEFLNQSLHDLQFIRERIVPGHDLRAALNKFLPQFREVELQLRRAIRFDSDNFEAAVELQQTMLDEDSAPLREDLASEHTAIALALSIFAICDEINEVVFWDGKNKLNKVPEKGDYIQLASGDCCGCYGRVAKIEARTVPTEDIPGPSTSHDNFHTMTHNLFQVIRRMAARANQKDRVILPHVLCILRNSGALFVRHRSFEWEPARDYNNLVGSVLDNLCQHYFISTNGGQPLAGLLNIDQSGTSGDTEDDNIKNASLKALGGLHRRWKSESRTCPFIPRLEGTIVK